MRRSHVEFLKRVTFTNRPSITVTVNVFCAHGLLANFGQNTFFPQMIMYLLPKAYSPAKLSDTMGRSMYCKEYISLYVHIIVCTGVPKNALSECCWSHGALAQSQVAGTPCVWKSIFWSFLTETKRDQAFPIHVHHGKI